MASASPPEPSSPTRGVEGGMSKELECVVCNSVMVDPRVLACQHAFCLRCLFGLIKRDRGTAISVTCPFRCSDRTRTSGDVRTLKRNPMIANLCLTLRNRAFTEGKFESCDWCSQPAAPPPSLKRGTVGKDGGGAAQFCDRCGAVTCAACQASRNCDHRYLCGGAADRAERSVRVLPRLITPRMSRTDALETYASRPPVSQQSVGTHSAAGRAMRGGGEAAAAAEMVLREAAVQEPMVQYLPAAQVEVDVKAGDDFATMSVTLLPAALRPLQGTEVEQELVAHAAVASVGVSPELGILHEAASTAEAFADVVSVVRRCAVALRSRLLGPRPGASHACSSSGGGSALAVRLTLAHVQAVDAVMAAARINILRPLKRLVLMGHILNVPHVEKMASRAVGAGDVGERRAIELAMVGQLELALAVSSRTYNALDDLSLGDDAMRDELHATVVACQDWLSADDSPAAGPGANTTCDGAVDPQVVGVASLCRRLAAAMNETMELEDRLAAVVRRVFATVSAEVTMDAETSDGFRDVAAKLDAAGRHTRVITVAWAQVAALACATEMSPPDDARRPLSEANELTPQQQDILAGVDQLVASLCPQIHDFRKQHCDMMAAAPHRRDPNQGALLQQLSALIVQAIDLFCKEQLMQCQSFAGLFARVKAFEVAVAQRYATMTAGLTDPANDPPDLLINLDSDALLDAAGRVHAARVRSGDAGRWSEVESAAFMLANDVIAFAPRPPPDSDDEGNEAREESSMARASQKLCGSVGSQSAYVVISGGGGKGGSDFTVLRTDIPLSRSFFRRERALEHADKNSARDASATEDVPTTYLRNSTLCTGADPLKDIDGVVVNAVARCVVPVNRSLTIAAVLSEAQRKEAIRMAIAAFSKLFPQAKNATGTLASTASTGLTLVPVALGQLRFGDAADEEEAGVWATNSGRLTSVVRRGRRWLMRTCGMSVFPSSRATADDDDDGEHTTAPAMRSSRSTPSARTLRFAVALFNGMVVQDALPVAPFYRTTEKVFEYLARPKTFAIVASSWLIVSYSAAVGTKVARYVSQQLAAARIAQE